MNSQRVRVLHSFSLLFLDAVLIVLAFAWAYQLRVAIPWPTPLANRVSFVDYLPLLLVELVNVIGVLFFLRQYVVRRAVSRLDQFYGVVISVVLGTVLALGMTVILFKNTKFEVEFARAMILYMGVLTVTLLMVGRILHQAVVDSLQLRGWGRDRLIIVGTGDVARMILQRILWSPQLGYEVVGLVASDGQVRHILGVPVLGMPADLPQLIKEHDVDEVIVATPEEGHRQVVNVISYCQPGTVSIKIFPDIFQFVTSQANINDLGGLPLLSVRDYAMLGYWLVFKRLLDLVGSAFGLVVLSPLLLVVAIAVKLESPGPVFFIQERMGLNGKPFPMIKFRSMRQDAEKDGPGWTVDNDPRRTKLGSFLRYVDVDELPQLINVLLGEMSLVGPRPEQPYYVDQFRQIVPRYMERHQVKAGMTGWAQINGMRGDTSIGDRTKYDLWYTENWSLFLDIKIILRTVWQVCYSFLSSGVGLLRSPRAGMLAVTDEAKVSVGEQQQGNL